VNVLSGIKGLAGQCTILKSWSLKKKKIGEAEISNQS
jgi:hypothetical protein